MDSDVSKQAGIVVGFVTVITLAVIVSGGYLSTAHTVDGPGTIGAPSGPAITIQGTTDINLSDPPSTGELTLRTADGNATFSSAGVTNATIHVDDLDGSWTNLTALDVSTALKVDAEGMAAFRVQGADTDSVSVAATRTADDGTVDFEYAGSTGQTDLTLWGVTAGTEFGAVDRDRHAVLDVATANASGAVNFDALDNSAHTVELQTNSGGPSISNMSPDGVTIRWQNETLSADIDDPDFPDDNVTADIYVNNTVVETIDVGNTSTISTTVGGLSEGSHDWYVVATDAYGNTTTSATKTFTVDHYDPVITDARPTGPQSQYPDTLEVDVTDGDFPKDGDQIDAYFELNGADVGTDTLNSNGTAAASVSQILGGTNTWSVALEDEYGQWTNQSYSFEAPDELEIRNESKPSELVDNANVTLRFYFPESGGVSKIVTRNTSDGTLNMTGLPTGRPFTVVADADGYFPRRIFVPSLFETQKVYLLPENKTAVDVIFKISDYSGSFPQDTAVLEVQRSLNDTWQTVVGDYFGANGEFPGQLRYNTRHRLVIRNTETGETRILGSYTPLASGEQTVTVAPQGIQNVTGAGVLINVAPQTRRLPPQAGVTIEASVQPASESELDNSSVSIYYDATNGGNVTLASSSSLSPDGETYTESVDLSNRSAGTVKVIVDAYTSDGQHVREVATYEVIDTASSKYSLLSVLGDFVTLVAPGTQGSFRVMLAIVLSIVLTAAVATRVRRISTEMVGLVHAGWITGFAIIGWVSYSLLFIVGAGWGALSFLGRRY